GGHVFADVSAVSALDYADDSRAVALVDWNWDGRMDMWVANRTAPRVRLLVNRTRNDHHFVALRLQGTTCNRDAIGARVELFVKNDDHPRRIKTLHAGDGYLSQSSKWLLFGLGSDTEIERINVRWPGGESEEFTGVDVDGHHLIQQGSGRAAKYEPDRPHIPENPLPVALPVDDARGRTVLVSPVLLPELPYRKQEGPVLTLDDWLGQPLLVNLWSQACLPCLQELSEWGHGTKQLQASGVRVLALNVDQLSGDDNGWDPPQHIQETLRRTGFAGESGYATSVLVVGLELVHREFVELQKPLPVPCSFLVDSQGRLAVIYKGRVGIDELLGDVGHLAAAAEVRRDSAVPFAGRWASLPFPPQHDLVLRRLLIDDEFDKSQAYVQRCWERLDRAEAQGVLTSMTLRLGESLMNAQRLPAAAETYAHFFKLDDAGSGIHARIGEQFLRLGEAETALRHFEASVPTTAREQGMLEYNTGLALLALRRPAEAGVRLMQAASLQPDDLATHYQLASALLATNRTKEAITHLHRTLEIRPGWAFGANDLAWILSTCDDQELRDGDRAVQFALQACEATRFQNPSTLATLAAAYAESGDFAKAQEVNQRAIGLVVDSGDEATTEKLRHRQTLYESGHPYRELRPR
ncbi:MAG: ASPIC/UnbV domain-containing protein, partial [Planctomycetales bacterium]|nr:ASPIC/UnbV domain-containing protein [Planctomycetales bacterium]